MTFNTSTNISTLNITMTSELESLWQAHQSVFVTGTDTEIGKTHVSSLLLQQLVAQGKKALGMKPIASGLYEKNGAWLNEDVEALNAASNVDVDKNIRNRYAFEPAIAPHIAAEFAQAKIDYAQIASDLDFCQTSADYVIVEGVGGWRVPLTGYQQLDQDVASLVSMLNLPVILVVGIKLGCINHAILTAEAIIQSGANLLGWVANNLAQPDSVSHANVETICRMLEAPLLAEFPYQAEK